MVMSDSAKYALTHEFPVENEPTLEEGLSDNKFALGLKAKKESGLEAMLCLNYKHVIIKINLT